MFSILRTFAILFGSLPVLVFGQSNRPFYMSTTATQAVPGGSPLYQNFGPAFTPQNLSQDTDLVSVFPEFLGVPFDLFATTATPPATHPWTIQMTNLANAVKSVGKPIMLQTVLVRDNVVARATNNNGSLQVQPNWAPLCVDFNSPQYAGLGNSYVNYVNWMARTFDPRYFVIMVEINLYYVHCGGDTASWRTLVNIERSAYTSAKQQNQARIVFASFKLEDLYGQTLDGYDHAQFTAMANVRRDRLGLATYAYGMQLSPGVFANPHQLPADYLTRIRVWNPSEPKIVITETGWNWDTIAIDAGGCVPAFLYSDPSYVSAYMNFLLYSAYAGGFDAITWWSDRDLILGSVMSTCYPNATPPAYTQCNGDIWCKAINTARASPAPGSSAAFYELVFKAFGSMGLRTYDGTPKPGLLGVWNQFLALPRQ